MANFTILKGKPMRDLRALVAKQNGGQLIADPAHICMISVVG